MRLLPLQENNDNHLPSDMVPWRDLFLWVLVTLQRHCSPYRTMGIKKDSLLPLVVLGYDLYQTLATCHNSPYFSYIADALPRD